ncbi:MAG: hypothetical protein O6945_05010 [Gammaproteobacteria bacterium]|nr:hypothetical protein [Gammaproteobacteria bacterium]
MPTTENTTPVHEDWKKNGIKNGAMVDFVACNVGLFTRTIKLDEPIVVDTAVSLAYLMCLRAHQLELEVKQLQDDASGPI